MRFQAESSLHSHLSLRDIHLLWILGRKKNPDPSAINPRAGSDPGFYGIKFGVVFSALVQLHKPQGWFRSCFFFLWDGFWGGCCLPQPWGCVWSSPWGLGFGVWDDAVHGLCPLCGQRCCGVSFPLGWECCWSHPGSLGWSQSQELSFQSSFHPRSRDQS